MCPGVVSYSVRVVVILPYFQEEMMVKEDPIKIREELEKEVDQENSVAVDRPVDRTQQRRNVAHIFDK